MNLTRRELVLPALASFGMYALLGEIAAAAGTGSRTVASWLVRQRELAAALADGGISQTEWSREIEALALDVDLSQLVAEIRRGVYSAMPGAEPKRNGHGQPYRRQLRFRAADGTPLVQSYDIMMLEFRPGEFIPPHMHTHSAALHLVTEGTMRVRAYNRIGDENGAALVAPSEDRILAPGSAKAMTTEVDNVHWFTAVTPTASALNIAFLDLGPPGSASTQQPIDLFGGTRNSDGTIRAPFLSWDAALERYAGA